MIHTQSIAIEGQSCVLLIIPPDWSAPVTATFSIRSEVTESTTGLQERRPDQDFPRIALRYQAALTGTDLQTLRSILGGLNSARIAIPFWPDADKTVQSGGLTQSDWTNRAIAGQLNVGWDDNLTNVSVTTAGNAPGTDFRAALLVGRLSKTTIRAIHDSAGTVEIAFAEDSNFASRTEPNLTDPAAWSADWPLNWTTAPEQSQRTLAKYTRIGKGRISATEGTEDVRLWNQTARLTLDQPQAASLISFFAARKGAIEVFELPSALKPGSETPTAPHEFSTDNARVRFADRDLRVEYVAPSAAIIDLRIEQQVESASQSQTPAAYASLYKFSYEGTTTTVTDWESTITTTGGTWTPARIEHGRLKQSLKPQNENCEITCYTEDIPTIEPLARLELETPAAIEIHQMTLPSGTPTMIFAGTITGAKFRGRVAKLTATAFGGALAKKLPRFQFSHTCNHTLFSHGCTRRRPTAMARANFAATGAFSAQWDEPKLLLHTVAYPGGSTPATHYYAGGWVETGTGTTRQVREIRGSWHIDGILYLALSRPFRTDQLAPAQLFTVYPGCDGEYATCVTKFANGENFGGFPFMPEYIEQAPQSTPTGAK